VTTFGNVLIVHPKVIGAITANIKAAGLMVGEGV
jgi:hypothetical protein